MRSLPPALTAEMAAQADAAAPREACGLVAMDEEGVAAKVYPVPNRAEGLGAYTIDPGDLFAVILETEGRGWEIGAVYHSHPSGPSRPSRTDLRSAFDPDWLSLIVSPVEGGWIVRAFRVDGRKASAVDFEGTGAGYPVAVPRLFTT